MVQPRYVEIGSNSFYGEYLQDQVVAQEHFLRKLRQLIDWNRFTDKLIQRYKGEGVVGRPPFDPAWVLKVERITYLYNLSERQVVVHVHENLPAKFFVGWAVDPQAPDPSTLIVFHERLLERGKLKVFEAMLEEIGQTAQQSGVRFGAIQRVDSVHWVANVNTAKDKKRAKNGNGPHDPDARWGAQYQRKVKTEDGQEIELTEYFFGYQAHVSLNAENGLITRLEVTSGEA